MKKNMTWAALLLIGFVSSVFAQHGVPNIYGPGQQWGELPNGRTWGSSSGVYPHRDSGGALTGKIWVFERCGGGNCLDSDLDPIMLFDLDGKLIQSFGAGLFVWPHGVHIDRQGNLWVADAVQSYCEPVDGKGQGHQIRKFSPEGELLMELGTAGVAGEGENTFRCPSDVLVLPDGQILVADGHNHGHGGSNRIVKFTADGKFVEEWGKKGSGPGEFSGLHALAMDSRGRVFVGDRANQRIQILDQDGNHLATWTQFGSPSGIYIDEDDVIYVTDSDSGFDPESTGKPRNPGFKRGIYIGDAQTGEVTSFIPDPAPRLEIVTSGAEGVAAYGKFVFGAQVGGSRGVLRYTRTE